EPATAEPATAEPATTTTETVSFDDVWEQEAAQEFGDLGPAESAGGRRRPGADRENRGDRGDRGPRRNPRRSGGAR
ncbi:MAG: transcription termination factor Rho, partial [Actinomycetota bacterium]|nr:transcription termination factor Rho [Actinomycetota bacterium]